jgi:hypothetical protein
MAKGKFIGSNQTRGLRQVGTYPLVQDLTQVTIDLPRGPHIESVIVRVAGTATITTTYTAVRNAAAFRFLRRADWVLNSNVTLDSVSGMQLAQSEVITRRNLPTRTDPAGFGVSAQPFEVSFVLDRAIMDMIRPKDSMLKTDVGVSNNQLRLQFGALSDMFTGAGVATYTNVTVSVSVVDYQEARDSNGDTPSPTWYAKRNGNFVSIASAGNGQQIKLSTGNRLRYVSMRILDAATQEPNIALLSRVRIQRAGDTRIDMATTDLLRLNQMAYGNALLSGQVVADFANNGQLGIRYSEYWPIPSSADTYLLVDTTAACIVETSTLEGVDLAQ